MTIEDIKTLELGDYIKMVTVNETIFGQLVGDKHAGDLGVIKHLGSYYTLIQEVGGNNNRGMILLDDDYVQKCTEEEACLLAISKL